MKSQDHDLFEAIWELIKWPDNMLCVALMRLTPNHLQIIHKFAIIIPWSIWWISWWYLWVVILKWIAHAWLQTRASGQYSSQDHQGDMYHSCTIHSTWLIRMHLLLPWYFRGTHATTMVVSVTHRKWCRSLDSVPEADDTALLRLQWIIPCRL